MSFKTTVQKTFTEIQEKAKTNQTTTRTVVSLGFGQAIHQGDLYLVYLGEGREMSLAQALLKLRN